MPTVSAICGLDREDRLVRTDYLALDRFGDTRKSSGLAGRPPFLRVEATVKRCGGEMRMVVPGATAALSPERHSGVAIKAIACARSWYDRPLCGETRLQRGFAHELGVNKNYVGRLMRCAFLAHQIVCS